MVNRNIIAIIPARGGSKRIPRKNIIELCGKPMIAWTIEAAIKSRYINKVIVSTDDEEIADISRRYGAEVPFLRQENNDDFSTVSMATISTVRQFESYSSFPSEIIVQLMANCPVRDFKDIDAALENFLKSDTHFQISCFKYGWMNPWWAHEIDETGTPIPLFNKTTNVRSQDLPSLYCPTGAIWIASKEKLLEEGTFYGNKHKFFPITWQAAIDIDDKEDLEMAEIVITQMKINEQ